jgi:peptide-methionine (S)-S-oxide reductase
MAMNTQKSRTVGIIAATAMAVALISGGVLWGQQGAETKPMLDEFTVDASEMTADVPKPQKDSALADAPGEAKAVLAGGCFWCTESVFQTVKGVKSVTSGYAGGDAGTANYNQVLTGQTGHAEAIEIAYDPSQVSYGQLLRVFFATHNPTTLNQQGADRGTQYRSAIFYANEEEKAIAEAYIKQLNAAGTFGDPIVTTLEPLDAFHEAEEYHQDYVKNNPNQPYVRGVALPKLEKLKKMMEQK